MALFLKNTLIIKAVFITLEVFIYVQHKNRPIWVCFPHAM